MNGFYKSFLRDDIRTAAPTEGRWIFLAAFGKHPGWDDHIEDIGMATQSLVAAKQLLYLEGIGGQIDSGAWESIPAAQRLPQFDHLLVWQRCGQLLLGRLWTSSDGKGRTRYPMVLCAHAGGLPLEWAALHMVAELERLKQACQATRSASEVASLISGALQTLRRRMPQMPRHGSREEGLSADRTRFLARPEWAPDHQPLLRILHQMHQQMGPYLAGQTHAEGDVVGLKPQQIRIPRAADSVAEAMVLWSQFFALQLPPDTPLLLTLPLSEPWVDATVGEPTSSEFFCLRASLQAIPLASNIPYHLEDGLRQKGEQLMAAIQRGENPWSSATEPAAAAGLTSRLSTLLTKRAHDFVSRVSGRKN